ncbi:MAG: hypothetical protein BA869_05925 [Desulfuromonadales bacterium C00003107]|jgi:hypothetical protein|nr:MAG: hypothetical protein BA869_05925 [Desulfuromonadales bacterium C00003107]
MRSISSAAEEIALQVYDIIAELLKKCHAVPVAFGIVDLVIVGSISARLDLILLELLRFKVGGIGFRY